MASRPRARETMSRARNFVVYYGTADIRVLAGFDLAIVEPAAHEAADIERARASGVLVCAYLSALEIGDSLDSRRRAQPGDYLLVRGERVRKQGSPGWVMDPRSAHWNRAVVEMAEERVLGAGYDGVFLDTVGDVEDPDLPPELAAELVPASAHMIGAVRRRLSDAVIIQNWGLGVLYRLTAPYLDAICWEGFPLSWPCDPWSVSTLDHLSGLSRSCGLRILLLSQIDPADITAPSAVERARQMQLEALRRRFLYYAAPGSYTAGVSTWARVASSPPGAP